MKKIVKIVVILIILASIFCATTSVMAETSGVKPGGYTGATNKIGDLNTDSIDKLGNQVIKIVSTVGTIFSVIVLVVLGIKYMMGSAEEKAEYKKTLLPYVIGAALVFAASSIATIIFNFTSNIG